MLVAFQIDVHLEFIPKNLNNHGTVGYKFLLSGIEQHYCARQIMLQWNGYYNVAQDAIDVMTPLSTNHLAVSGRRCGEEFFYIFPYRTVQDNYVWLKIKIMLHILIFSGEKNSTILKWNFANIIVIWTLCNTFVQLQHEHGFMIISLNSYAMWRVVRFNPMAICWCIVCPDLKKKLISKTLLTMLFCFNLLRHSRTLRAAQNMLLWKIGFVMNIYFILNCDDKLSKQCVSSWFIFKLP